MTTTELSNYEKALVRYESARRLVRDLKLKRHNLILSCEIFDDGNCLNGIYDEWLSSYDHDYAEQDHIKIPTFLEFCKEENERGDMCDSCYEAIKIKRTSLADAKKEFGLAKKAISYAGSKIIKMMETNHDN